MNSALFLTLFLFAIQTAAGVAPMKWPERTWLAGWIFYLSGFFALVCLAWWVTSNRDWVMPYIQPPQVIAIGIAIALGGLIWQWSTGPQNYQPSAAASVTPPAAAIAPPTVDAMSRPLPKGPYQPGPILQKKYTRNEAQVMIDALIKITDTAADTLKLEAPTDVFTALSRFWSLSVE
jgi:hypothetical protein